MSTALTTPKSHIMTFKPRNVGGEWVTDEPVYITEAQYQGIKAAKTALVEIENNLYSLSEIRRIEPIPVKRRTAPERWMYDSDDEYNQAVIRFYNVTPDNE